ncbi:SGNH/GDSL hydrolase family protein [Brucella sp.]|uniref:SGNH/GDSL hydrolase family protein n=1 Tax=Brucella sp. TaxID=52132 RepID=UPI002899ED05|nr:SGNH/GDSL hydrolase family protein [Brucella sp.]
MYAALSSLGSSIPARYNYEIKIACYGDSTTEGWQSYNDVSAITKNNVPSLLQSYMRQEFSSSAVVINKGVGSTQASQILNGTDGRNKTWSQEMKETPASVILVNFCLNDAYYHEVPTTGYERETPSRYQQIIREMVSIARDQGKQTVLLEPNPVSKPPRQAVLPYYVEALNNAAVLEGVRIVKHFAVITSLDKWEAGLSDGVHPGDEMYIAKAKREFSTVAEIIRQKL